MTTGRRTAIVIGFLLGLLHLAMFLLTGTGAGHGPQRFSEFLGPIYFGVGSIFWYVLPPFQYALYADIAFRRDRKLGLLLALLHYGSGALVIGYYAKIGALATKYSEVHWNTFVLEGIVNYLVFIVLNVIYFRRILYGPRGVSSLRDNS